MKLIAAIILCALLCACSPEPAEPQVGIDRYMADGNYAMAMLAASDALERGGLSPEEQAANLLIIAECHSAAGNHYAASEYARRATETAPGYLPAHRALVDEATLAGNYDLALSSLAAMPDGADRAESLQLTVAPALASGRTELAAEALRTLRRDSVELSVEQSVALARIYLDEAKADSAVFIIAEIDVDDVAGAASLRALADYLADRGETARALALYRRLALEQADAVSAIGAAGIYSTLYDYEHTNRMEQALRERNSRQRFTFTLILASVALLGAVALILYIRARGRRRLLESENRLLLAAEELRAHQERSRSTIGRLFRESYDSIELAANLIIDGSASRTPSASMLLKRLEAKVDACRTPQFLARLEKAVNELHADVIARMRADIPGLSDTDLTTALYLATGLSQRALCLLLDCTAASLYNKKYRLKRKIQDSGASPAAIEEYLAIIT